MQRIRCKAFDVTIKRQDDKTILICHSVNKEFIGKLRYGGRYTSIRSDGMVELRHDVIYLMGTDDRFQIEPKTSRVESILEYEQKLYDLKLAASFVVS